MVQRSLILLLALSLLSPGPVWAKKKKSTEGEPTQHRRHHHSKNSKESKDKSGADFKVESEIDKKSVTFDFKEKDQKTRPQKKTEENP